MPEILILIHGNRFLMNKIKLLLMKNPALTEESGSSDSVSYCLVIVGMGGMIQYSIYNNFSVFCKKFNLETENISKINSFHHGIQ